MDALDPSVLPDLSPIFLSPACDKPTAYSDSFDVNEMNNTALARRRRRRRVADDKRKRAPRACDRCKARKSKCIEATPGSCERCLKSDLACQFEKDISSGEGEFRSPGVASNVTQTGTTPGNGAEDTISINSHQADRIMWPRFLSRLREAFSLDLQNTPEAHDMMAMQQHITGPRSLMPAEYQRLRKAAEAFPPRPVADFLLSVCIRHGVDAFFYFDQTRFLSDIDEFYTDLNSPLRADCGFVGLALAAFALGSQWTPLEKPEGSASSVTPTIDDNDPGRIFHGQLKTLVPDIIERSCVRSIQVPFIMGVYLMPTSAVGSSYVYLGLALRKALAFDLHQENDDSSIDEREREGRRRLWWSVYSLERVTAIKLNRTRAIDIDNVTLSLPSYLPAMDQMQMFDNLQHQLAFARITKILDRVADIGGQGARISTAAVDRVEVSLKEWKRSLPSKMSLANIDPRDSDYRVTLHIYLNYYYAWIAMGKVSVVTVIRAHLRQHLGHESQAGPVEQAVRDLSSACIKAASKILRLFEMLTNTGNIVRFSFTDFQGCSIATIVTLLAGILDRDSGYEARVNFGLDCLRKMSAGNMTAKVGVRFVEALQSIANEAVTKLRRSEAHQSSSSGSEQSAAMAAALEYTRWAQWLSRTTEQGSHQDGSGNNTPPGAGPAASDVSMLHHVSNAEGMQAHGANMTAGETTTTRSWQAAAGGGHVQVVQGQHDEMLPPSEIGAQSFNGGLGGGSAGSAAAAAAASASGSGFDMFAAGDGLSATLYGDDQNFLMGLTGLDVLDFSELATPP